MELNEYNQKAINDIYKNAHIALQSISDLIPAVEDDDIVCASAENTRRDVFLKNDSFVVNKDLYGIFYIYVKWTAKLYGKNYSAKLVYSAYYSRRFHIDILLDSIK